LPFKSAFDVLKVSWCIYPVCGFFGAIFFGFFMVNLAIFAYEYLATLMRMTSPLVICPLRHTYCIFTIVVIMNWWVVVRQAQIGITIWDVLHSYPTGRWIKVNETHIHAVLRR